MTENFTYNSLILQIEGFNVSKDFVYPVFLAFLLAYIILMVLNLGITFLVLTDKTLQQPMYLFFCSLSVNDIIGNSVMVPRMLVDMLRPQSERIITYYECVLQAFITHIYGTSAHTVLMIMAFDRYVAICNPLRYAVIMTNKVVIKLTVSAWGGAFVLVGILLGLTVRLNRCRVLITHPYCDNASLFKLSCENVFINNVYGLLYSVVLLTSSIGSIVVTYTKITVICLTSKNKALNRKALKTCSTHLVLYLIMLLSGLIAITMHRFPQYRDYGKLCSILFHVVPGSLNPVIYGAQSAEIFRSLSKLFRSKSIMQLF